VFVEDRDSAVSGQEPGAANVQFDLVAETRN
jgi:hypothetical protein